MKIILLLHLCLQDVGFIQFGFKFHGRIRALITGEQQCRGLGNETFL